MKYLYAPLWVLDFLWPYSFLVPFTLANGLSLPVFMSLRLRELAIEKETKHR